MPHNYQDIPDDPSLILHKIWFGSSFLSRDDVRDNLQKAASEAPQTPGFTKIIWTDRDLNEEEKSFADLEKYNVKDIRHITEVDPDFFQHTTKEGKVVDFKEYVTPQTEELFPDYGRRSDVARALLLKKFSGLYMDTDELLIDSIIDSIIWKKPKTVEEIAEAGSNLYEGVHEEEFMINKDANSIIFTKQKNSPQINQVLDRICSNIDLGYEKVRGFCDVEKNGLKRHDIFTVFSTGPSVYKPLNEKSNFLPSNYSLSWVGKDIFSKVEKLENANLDEEDFKDRLFGQLKRDARDKMGIVNLAKYRYIVGQVMNIPESDAMQVVNETVERVKEEFPEWHPRELSSLEDVQSVYEARKIYKYERGLSSDNRNTISGLCEAEVNPEQMYKLFMVAFKKQDNDLLQSIYENLDAKLVVDMKNNKLFNLALQSSDEIFEGFMSFVSDGKVKVPEVAQLRKGEYVFDHFIQDGSRGSPGNNNIYSFDRCREILNDSKPDLFPQHMRCDNTPSSSPLNVFTFSHTASTHNPENDSEILR